MLDHLTHFSIPLRVLDSLFFYGKKTFYSFMTIFYHGNNSWFKLYSKYIIYIYKLILLLTIPCIVT